MKFWLARGVDGFRLDAVRYFVATGPGAGQVDQPETHAFLKRVRAVLQRDHPQVLLVAEAWAAQRGRHLLRRGRRGPARLRLRPGRHPARRHRGRSDALVNSLAVTETAWPERTAASTRPSSPTTTRCGCAPAVRGPRRCGWPRRTLGAARDAVPLLRRGARHAGWGRHRRPGQAHAAPVERGPAGVRLHHRHPLVRPPPRRPGWTWPPSGPTRRRCGTSTAPSSRCATPGPRCTVPSGPRDAAAARGGPWPCSGAPPGSGSSSWPTSAPPRLAPSPYVRTLRHRSPNPSRRGAGRAPPSPG